jgi:hypothetical protein
MKVILKESGGGPDSAYPMILSKGGGVNFEFPPCVKVWIFSGMTHTISPHNEYKLEHMID